jgi:hypothetical protein
LENIDEQRICTMNVVNTSFETTTKPKGMLLVHLEGNDGRTRVKRNHQSCLRHMGLPYFVVKGWVTRFLPIQEPIVFCFVLELDLGFWT